MPESQTYELLQEILAERNSQTHTSDFDNHNTINDWSTYICRYATRNADNPSSEAFAEDLTKVAALVLAALEAYKRNNNSFPPRHYDQ